MIENVFDKAINSCFSDFSAISKPIVSVQEINSLVQAYKTNLPKHYNMMKVTLGIDKKLKKQAIIIWGLVGIMTD